MNLKFKKKSKNKKKIWKLPKGQSTSRVFFGK